MKTHIILLLAILCGIALAELPFAVRAGKYLADFATENGYTAQQVENAPASLVLNKLGIDPQSRQAKQYISMEDIIKGHAVNFMGLAPEPTLKDRVMGAIQERYPNATITKQAAGVYVISLNDPNEV